MMRFTGKHGIVHEVDHHRPQPQADRRKRARTCPARSVPIYQRRRRAAADHLRRRQRLYPGSDAAATSPPSISAPGARASSRSTRCSSKAENARISVKTVLEPVAEALGNTPAISRKSYVHPALIEAVKDDRAIRSTAWSGPRARKWLSSRGSRACSSSSQPQAKRAGAKRSRLIDGRSARRHERRHERAASTRSGRRKASPPGWSLNREGC